MNDFRVVSGWISVLLVVFLTQLFCSCSLSSNVKMINEEGVDFFKTRVSRPDVPQRIWFLSKIRIIQKTKSAPKMSSYFKHRNYTKIYGYWTKIQWGNKIGWILSRDLYGYPSFVEYKKYDSALIRKRRKTFYDLGIIGGRTIIKEKGRFSLRDYISKNIRKPTRMDVRKVAGFLHRYVYKRRLFYDGVLLTVYHAVKDSRVMEIGEISITKNIAKLPFGVRIGMDKQEVKQIFALTYSKHKNIYLYNRVIAGHGSSVIFEFKRDRLASIQWVFGRRL